jgi:hypothetical protein
MSLLCLHFYDLGVNLSTFCVSGRFRAFFIRVVLAIHPGVVAGQELLLHVLRVDGRDVKERREASSISLLLVFSTNSEAKKLF